MNYMLDTNICIHAMRNNHPGLSARLESCHYGELIVSAISLAELEFGILAATADESRQRRFLLETILDDLVVVPFDAAAAKAYAEIRKLAPERNRNALDKLIAAHAQSLGAVLVTNNESDFKRFPALAVENWAA